MKKKFFAEVGVSLLSLFLASLLSLLIVAMVLRFVDILIETDPFVQNIIKLIVSILVVSATIGAISYLLSYKKAEFNIKSSSGIFWLSILAQFLISLLLKFNPIISGGVLYLAGFFEFGSAYAGGADVSYIGLLDYIPAFLILSVIYYIASVVCGIIGKNNRLRDREELYAKSGEQDNNQ